MKNNSEKKRGLQMTLVRLGYVAMSVHLKNASPSQTMTFAQFSKLSNREAAIRKLESNTVFELSELFTFAPL